MSLAAVIARASGGVGGPRGRRDGAGAVRRQQAREEEVRGKRTRRGAASAEVRRGDLLASNFFSNFCFSQLEQLQSCTPVACECPGVPATSRGCVIPNQASARRESAAAEPGGLGEAECPWRAPESATSRGPWESGLREWQRHG